MYAFTFCPKKVISFAPLLTKSKDSFTNSFIDLEYSSPLVYGTTQNLQNLLQPSCIVKKLETLLLEFLIMFKLSNFSITLKSVKLIFFESLSIFEIISLSL